MKKIFKILLILTLVAGLIFVVTACDEKEDNKDTEITYKDYTVTVVDDFGTPVRDVVVKFTNQDGESKSRVTDENGVEHWTTVSFSAAAHANHTWYEAADITTHNINNNGYGANTVGYRVTNVGVNLSEYAGQTVTLSLRAITDSGRAVVIYSAFITVPAN
jgi:hypothetical protein